MLLTTLATAPASCGGVPAGDILRGDRESLGVPDVVHASADLRVRVPLAAGYRSLDL